MSSLVPSELLKGLSMVPDLGHMFDLLALEFHHIGVISVSLLSSGLLSLRVVNSSMGANEDGTATHGIELLVLSKAKHFIVCVRQHLEKVLQGVSVVLKCIHCF